jgi:hypothetical protein
MSVLLTLLVILLFADTDVNNEKWGQLGHYVTGEIAEKHLTETARKQVSNILDNTSMALATVWMDDIRSDPACNHTRTWHWVTIPAGKTYEEAEQEEGGDIIWALERLIYEIPGTLRLSYDYRYKNRDIIYKRLLQAGIRLAGVLNEIYED